jgi:hypothetical protein
MDSFSPKQEKEMLLLIAMKISAIQEKHLSSLITGRWGKGIFLSPNSNG